MDNSVMWRTFLAKWPPKMEHRGVVVTNAEQVSFVDFFLSEQAALFERVAPDAMGGRKLIIPYNKIEAIKITESIDSQIFAASGFMPVASSATSV